MKGLATQQLILLALGIIVLAVIGYLLYSQFVKTSKTLSSSDCQTNVVAACNKCKTCVTAFFGIWSGVDCPQCDNTNPGWSKCNSVCSPPIGCDVQLLSLANGFLNPKACAVYGAT